MNLMSDVYRLDGKIAIVMGAANGIGSAVAYALAGAGANVVCTDIDERGAENAARAAAKTGARTLGLKQDVRDLREHERAVKATNELFGGIDVLVYGAAVREPTATVVDLGVDDWENLMRVNVTGSFLACKATIPTMIARGGGSIILIASQMGRVGAHGRAAYCAAKGALIQFVKVLAADHAAQDIRANTLSPGAIETERVVHRYGSIEAARAIQGPKHLLGRLGLPEEIGRAAVFLASDASSFMTGADLLVDGGYTAL